MNEQTVRIQLAEIQSQLSRNEEEHEYLTALLKGYEGYLRFFGSSTPSEPTDQAALPINNNLGKPAISFRGTVRKVVEDARGESLHSKEILARARARGASTNSKNPLSATDLTLRNIPGIQKMKPRTWRWAGDNITPKDRPPRSPVQELMDQIGAA